MMKPAGRRLFRSVNARTGNLPIALNRENNGALSRGDAGKRRPVYQVNGGFLRVLDDRAELATRLQKAIVNLSGHRLLAGEM